MKLSFFFLIIPLMQVAASTSAQTITLNKQNTSLTGVFEEIMTQTDYDFSYSEQQISKVGRINISVTNASIIEVLDKCFEKKPFTYSIQNKTITIRKKEFTFFESIGSLLREVTITGSVADTLGKPLVGATIKILGESITVRTNDQGGFTIISKRNNGVLVISYLGYKTQEVGFSEVNVGPFEVTLKEVESGLQEVEVVSTGFQQLPKERATGSFILIDSALLNRKVSRNILDRLDGVTSGLIFNKNKTGNTSDISIRGRSTILGNPNPLIILDNFPYDGNLENINPMDIESVSVLKDAAAASIWGVRAGNGVIVLTTKKGKLNQKPQVSFNSNVTIGTKPDLYYLPQLTNKEYIEVEQFLFDKGRYNTAINNRYGALSPAVEIMLLRRNNNINDSKHATMLDSISQHDSKSELNKYYYRESVTQQYQLNVKGGGQFNKYYVSLGYDNNLSNTVGNSTNRLTLNANNSTNLFNNKVELSTGVIFTLNNINNEGSTYKPRYPYSQIEDANGNPLAVTNGTLRLSYVDTVGAGRLLDWHYRPLDELRNKYRTSADKMTDYRFNTGITYHIVKGLDFSGTYTFQKGVLNSTTSNSLQSYSTRNQINLITSIDQTTGVVTRPIPLGDILSNVNSSYYSHYGRGQFSFNRSFSQKHQVSAIAGYEIKDYRDDVSSYMLYGYDPETATNLNSTINYANEYRYYYRSLYTTINPGTSNYWNVDRYRSYFGNFSYTYDNKYIVSGSARRDESNIFGVKTNQKGVPLWSAGLAWNISSEQFYSSSLIPYLKLRLTYGYNGNVDKTTSAYLTANSMSGLSVWDENFLEIVNPPNPSLRWEKVKNTNIGIDFGTRNNKITGSIEYWIKKGKDLIGNSPIAQQTGITTYRGNNADITGHGLDILLNSNNIVTPTFTWQTNLLFNYNTDKITNYKGKQASNSNIVNNNYQNPIEGHSYYSLFTYKWMGLNATGDPQGILNGLASTDYSSIAYSYKPEDLVYSGTLTPQYYGSLRNTFNWRQIELSFNITYKFDYVFKRTSLDNTLLYGTYSTYEMPDYGKRWQQPGDESTTNVPALVYPLDFARQELYNNSEILVEKGDHIRLQDIRLAYTLRLKQSKLPFRSLQVYSYASNIGILWKATKYKIDPDYPNALPASRTLSFGLKADF
ncbi:SusC/RagA family TonB-linked outer membrane protein [Pedobacter westerhofensis]|nr:SusC/RagA family TonB-linked outer membrane protein [Pedobacter westerhofensis]